MCLDAHIISWLVAMPRIRTPVLSKNTLQTPYVLVRDALTVGMET